MNLGAWARPVALVGSVWCGLASGQAASAQTAAPAGSAGTAERPPNIELSFTGGVDRVTGGGSIDATAPAGEGPHSQAQASWWYTRPARTRSVTFSGNSAVRYFPESSGSMVGSKSVGFAGTWILGRPTTISAR